MNQRVEISCDTFGGYYMDIPLHKDDPDWIPKTIKTVCDNLHATLVHNRLRTLANRLTEIRHLYHVHDVYGDILYICNHCQA